MFTGIVEQIGTVSALVDNADGRWLSIAPTWTMDHLKLGDSISVNGCCLTVIGLETGTLALEVSHETLRRTNLGLLNVSDPVNLERPLKLSDRLDGHLVSGHIDTIGTVDSIEPEGFSKLVTITLPEQYAPFLVEKGSVAIDGISLTVVNCYTSPTGQGKNRSKFSVALIPYTMEITTFGSLHIGQRVNIETDLVAKYINRRLSLGISLDSLSPAEQPLQRPEESKPIPTEPMRCSEKPLPVSEEPWLSREERLLIPEEPSRALEEPSTVC